MLDLRNKDEFGRQRIEAMRPVEALNIPYFEFIDDEDLSMSRVAA